MQKRSTTASQHSSSTARLELTDSAFERARRCKRELDEMLDIAAHAQKYDNHRKNLVLREHTRENRGLLDRLQSEQKAKENALNMNLILHQNLEASEIKAQRISNEMGLDKEELSKAQNRIATLDFMASETKQEAQLAQAEITKLRAQYGYLEAEIA